MNRRVWSLAHRYVGLVLAGFLLIAGFTGAFLAFFNELDAAVNPELFRVDAPPAARPLDAFVLRERLLARHPEWSIDFVDLAKPAPGESVRFFVTGAADDEIFVDPYIAEILGSRRWGAISQGTKNLMPFVYELHYSLAFGIIGTYAFGIIALTWTIDCFVGFYLTLPRVRRVAPAAPNAPQRSWLSRWKPAWMIRRTGGSFKLKFDMHRAGGLWVWAMLLVFAWSSVAFNLREVYNPVMRAVASFPDEDLALSERASPLTMPALSWDEALLVARSRIAALAQQHDFQVRQERWFGYEPAYGLYSLSVNSTLDVGTELPRTQIWLDGNTGTVKLMRLPTGAHAGTTVTSWLYSLHMGKVWGLPFRIFICFMGACVAMLSVTGIVVWLRKRGARLATHPDRTAPRTRAAIGRRGVAD